MSEYATNGAMLVCTCGSAPSSLIVTSNMTVMAQNQAVATVLDKIPMANIMPFGVCSLKPSIRGFRPCIPVTASWIGFNGTVQVSRSNTLLKTSMIQCKTGGIISFQHSGQMSPHKVVTISTSPQIETLKKAAIEAIPFCEECEKKKAQQKPEITRILWLDESGLPKELHQLKPEEEMTLCIQTRNIEEGEQISISVKDSQGRKYKGELNSLKFTAKVESDGAAYVDNVKLEYE